MGLFSKANVAFKSNHTPQSSMGETEFSTGTSESSYTSNESNSSYNPQPIYRTAVPLKQDSTTERSSSPMYRKAPPPATNSSPHYYQQNPSSPMHPPRKPIASSNPSTPSRNQPPNTNYTLNANLSQPNTPYMPRVNHPPNNHNSHSRNNSDNNNSFNDDSFMVRQPSRSAYYVPQSQQEEEESEDDDEDDDEDEEDDDEDDDEQSVSTSSSFQPQQHPYYEQYKQYYAAMAQQQQMYGGQFPMYGMPQGFNNQMYPNMPYNPYYYGGMPMQQQIPQQFSGMPSQPQTQLQDPQPQPQHSITSKQRVVSKSQPDLLNIVEENTQARSGKTSRSVSRSEPDLLNTVAQQDEVHQENVKQNNDLYLKSLKVRQKETKNNDNELISNSRKSLIRANRYPSEPVSLASRVESMSSIQPSNRISSLASNFKAQEVHEHEHEDIDDGFEDTTHEESFEEDHTEPQIESVPPTMPASQSIAFNLSELNLSDKQKGRYVSDYMQLFDAYDEEDESVEVQCKELKPEVQHTPIQHSHESLTDLQPVSHKFSQDSQIDLHSSPYSAQSNEDFSRKQSSTSNSSYGSIQSESDFKVAPPSEVSEILHKEPSPVQQRVKTPPVQEKSKPKKKKKTPPPPPMAYTSNSQSPPPGMMSPPMGPVDPMLMNHMMSNPFMSQNHAMGGMYDRRMSMVSLNGGNNRNSMLMPNQMMNDKRHSMAYLPQQLLPPPPPPPPQPQFHISDSTINKKVQEFIKLRVSIRSGNKSNENRIKWVKSLITATNYKLYSFINIKGEPIPPEYSATSKGIFVSEAMKHLTRLLREYENENNDASEECKREAFYMYGSLLKHDYDYLYNQNFNVQKNIQISIEYFEKCLELNHNDHESMYKLGEIFEYEFPDEFSKALRYYKKSAKLGYNRAIYKIAMLYLEVPSLRSIKYFRYLRDLSSIDLNDIVENEKDEFSEVIGLASYQLGKIYEGKYPGDLKLEDEFIIQSLELAPVNYSKALTYYNKSAKLSCLLSQVKLGNVYEFGELNRQRNADKSIQWYLKAATSPLSFRRHPEAMVGLSRWSLSGSQGASKHIPGPNPERAVMWCDRAIQEFESAEAYYFMGELSSMGFSTIAPESWYSKAYELGFLEAGHKLGYKDDEEVEVEAEA
ncbi:hypothetical protein DFJ63DRAFT_313052 [Scheffersomyces coipomensis]|uniref:uncharacterized protein n=1 Tax=Scheffersomyces coipomensis TaxID=1788519 RepID=UPI00315CB6D6